MIFFTEILMSKVPAIETTCNYADCSCPPETCRCNHNTSFSGKTSGNNACNLFFSCCQNAKKALKNYFYPEFYLQMQNKIKFINISKKNIRHYFVEISLPQKKPLIKPPEFI